MRKGMRRALVLGSLLAVLGGGVVAMGLTGVVESWLFYFPSRRAFVDAPGAEAVTFQTPDGLRMSGWFWSGGDAPEPGGVVARAADDGGEEPPTPLVAPDALGRRPTILVAHGNAGCLPDHDEFCAFLRDYGFNVLLFDYRGYGRSDLPTRGLRRDDLVIDAQAALEYLLTREDVDPERVGLLGYSLGGNIGLAMAGDEPRVRAVATLSTFSRWQAVASDHAGWLGPMLIPPGLDAAESVTRLGDRPYLIVHGDRDDIVPYRHSGILEEAALGAGVGVERITVPGADHLNMTARREVRDAMAAFFAGALSRPAGGRQVSDEPGTPEGGEGDPGAALP
ncbi:MAG: alpha/beta fold hydrolase [Phycisphaerales bacterium]|nr:alpha/beta fold hydrolase [Phycisphaerales bacterium]